ncbi:EpsG family protein [Mariniflexile litorale]|uniref:EpsG family protein n=1 Tax=Mariniflexile litorale TaxID=3045158 RepID=A0AAU7EFP0_9FLAO|nr:EpsG family protein [Mariniflexile sp. KMM 9835]MDQ8211512.1 EpsG family protein [Mariniflexile sp. KMM 9835]
MIDFVPLQYYFDIFINIVFFVIACVLLHTYTLTGFEQRIRNLNRFLSIFLVVFTIIYLGLRPVSGRYFTDMSTYAAVFEWYKAGRPLYTEGDIGFDVFMYFMAKFGSIHFFFFTCMFLYVMPLYWACKIWFPNFYLFGFLMLIASFSFYTYGVNGMRNGIATSLFILGIALNKRKVFMILILLLSLSMHQSMKLPILAFILTYFVNDTKKYLLFWLFSIFLSIAIGPTLVNLFSQLGLGGEKLSGYLATKPSAEDYSSIGFRYDFLLYSAAPVFAGYYFVIKRNFNDVIYKRILHTYLICNAMWIMVITASFSNRFAYLSWFLMGIVIIYPYLKEVFWENQFYRIGIVTLLYFGFTYFMSYIYYG